MWCFSSFLRSIIQNFSNRIIPISFTGTNLYDLDLNGFAMTFTGTDKNVTISNLNILAGSTGGAISNRGALNIDSAKF